MLTALRDARRLGYSIGIPSICTAHETAIRATLRRGQRTGITVLIEATCNQVNQFGGYTGLKPGDFMSFVRSIAAQEGLSSSRLILGGDHLGPNPWRMMPAHEAMDRAAAMVADYVRAGFTKIHLDASMGCAGEPAALDDEVIALRAAQLAAVAEATARDAGLPGPHYVIGTEVPVPGGADHVLDAITPTSPQAALRTIAIHRDIFTKAGLAEAFERAIALVVQPGVEFGHENVVTYDSTAQALSSILDDEEQFVFEAHSTDYQSVTALRRLVHDGFPILKVGPAVTFALREALYGLDAIASEVSADAKPGLRQAMERLMLTEPGNWSSHYHGDAAELRRQRHFSYSDRIRYYWQHPDAIAAVQQLFAALGDTSLPPTLVSQFLPDFAHAGPLVARDVPILAVDTVLATYADACAPGPTI